MRAIYCLAGEGGAETMGIVSCSSCKEADCCLRSDIDPSNALGDDQVISDSGIREKKS